MKPDQEDSGAEPRGFIQCGMLFVAVSGTIVLGAIDDLWRLVKLLWKRL